MVRRALAALLALASVSGASAATPESPREHEVKASVLYQMAHLVHWPGALAPSSEPFVIAVAGDDPFGATLERVLAGKTMRGHPVLVLRFPYPAAMDPAGVHILFVGGEDDGQQRRTLAAVAGHPVLTVGETKRFAERGGMIGFRVKNDGRVTFDINLRRAEDTRLRISSQLLKLARIVGPR